MEFKKTINIKPYFKSFINNRVLFDLRKKSILFPIIIFFLIITLLSLPTYFLSKSQSGDELIKNFPQIQQPMEKILTSSLDCSIKNKTLLCDDTAESVNMVIGDDIKYTIIVNQKTIALDTQLSYANKKDSDNLIILYTQTVRIRYVERDHVNETIKSYEIIGDYSKLEGFNFKQTAERIKNNPDLLNNEIKNFVLNVHESTLNYKLITGLSSSLLSFTLLLFVSCLIIKGKLHPKKGFKFWDCFKICTISSIPSIILCTLIGISSNINVASSTFGLLFIGRIIFIYFKYIFTNKIFKELYELEKDERFNF